MRSLTLLKFYIDIDEYGSVNIPLYVYSTTSNNFIEFEAHEAFPGCNLL
jgi:hypothetical protein